MSKKTIILLSVISFTISCYSQKKLNNIIEITNHYPTINLSFETSYCNKTDTAMFLNLTSLKDAEIYNFDYNHSNLTLKYNSNTLTKKDTLYFEKNKNYIFKINSKFPHQIYREVKITIKTNTSTIKKSINLYFFCKYIDIKKLQENDTIILKREKCCLNKYILGFRNFGEATNIKIFNKNGDELFFETYYFNKIFYIDMSSFKNDKYKLLYESYPCKYNKDLLIQ